MKRKILQIIKDSEKRYNKFHDEYLEMASKNRANAIKVRNKIDAKSIELKKKKENRERHFDIIRSK